MAIQLTRALLSTFVENAAIKAQATLSTSGTLTPSVFGKTALLWLIPPHVSHPLRSVLGLSTAFILITAYTQDSPEYLKLALERSATLTCGAEPLTSWSSLATPGENIAALSQYAYGWGSGHRLEPLDRNKARILTTQYAQILPALKAEEDDAALPMLIFTKEIAELDDPMPPFYLAVFSPSTPFEFASVIALKNKGMHTPTEDINMCEQPASEESKKTPSQKLQHWVEYDLLGSPLQADDAFRELQNDGVREDVDSESASHLLSKIAASASSSFVILRGIWSSEPKEDVKAVELPPNPPTSAQWMLELVSTQLPLEPEASKSLKSLLMEIKRLEAWCERWALGSDWTGPNDSADTGQLEFKAHPWQQPDESESAFDKSVAMHGSEDTMDTDITFDEVDADASQIKGGQQAAAKDQKSGAERLQEHRELFGKRIDEFIEASIFDTRGSTVLGRLGRTRGIHGVAGLPIREDLDFTERLWNVSHYAHDDSDLSELIAAVAEGLETRRLQPYIHHSNQSPIAQLIRGALQMAQQKTLIDAEGESERLAGQLDVWIDGQPLDALVHVGLHKLRSDFWFYFINGQLAAPKQLEPFLDMSLEPPKLIPRFRLLLRVLEVWSLIQQAVPGIPRHFACQVVGSLLSHFLPALAKIDDEGCGSNDAAEDSAHAGQDGADAIPDRLNVFGAKGRADSSRDPVYEDRLKITLYLPLYSAEVQDFVLSITDGFEPARYTIAASVQSSSSASAFAPAAKRRVKLLTRAPALVDRCFAADFDDAAQNLDADISLSDLDAAEDEKYTVFEARLL